MWVWLICRWHVLFRDGFIFLSAASLWGPYKDIWHTVVNALWRRQPEAVHLLDMILKKHKPDFISLFKNPVGNFLLCFLDLLFFFFKWDLESDYLSHLFIYYVGCGHEPVMVHRWREEGNFSNEFSPVHGTQGWPQTAWQGISLLNQYNFVFFF